MTPSPAPPHSAVLGSGVRSLCGRFILETEPLCLLPDWGWLVRYLRLIPTFIQSSYFYSFPSPLSSVILDFFFSFQIFLLLWSKCTAFLLCLFLGISVLCLAVSASRLIKMDWHLWSTLVSSPIFVSFLVYTFSVSSLIFFEGLQRSMCEFDPSYLFILFYFTEKGREGEREGEKHQCVVASCTPHTGNPACNTGIHPD